MNVAFEMIHSDERKLIGEGEGLGIGDADEEGSGKAGTGGDGDSIEIGERDAGLLESRAHDRDDGAKVLPAGELGNDSSVASVGGDLRGNG